MTTAAHDDPAGEHVDVLIVGAGLSGIGAAYRLQTSAPGRATPSSRGATAIGGTWDLFRYPGSGATRTCSRSATPSGRGREPKRSPTGRRSSSTSATPWRGTASTATSASATGRRRRRGRRATGAVDRRRRVGDATPPGHLRASSSCAAVTTTTTQGHPPDFAGGSASPAARAPAALARGPRLRRQAGRGHRQRRHGGDARPRAGRGGRPRHDAAAVADLHRGAAGATPSPTGCVRKVLPARAAAPTSAGPDVS